MTLSAGARLGPYEVTGSLGAGGMGEVYRARDTRLERSVAIKVLPADLAADPERRARFEREARTISTLTHPHICALYDIGDHEGTPYLVMEHLAGETLADRLAKGPLPLEQALDIVAQIADALSAAHKHGIVHRDLKPANVMLTKAGAKLLDFGLAKLRAVEGVRLVRDSSATVARGPDVTAAGTLVGTLPYMAPEQVEGREADARTDLWALGCLLYEVVTGQRAFEGATTGSLVGAILAKEPPALASRQPLTPPALERLVKRCLAKDPDQRWDSAHDVADELRWIADEARRGRTPTGGLSTEATTSAAAAARRTRRQRLVMGALALATVVAGVSAALTWLMTERRAASAPNVTRLLLDTRPADGLLPVGGPGRGWRPGFNRPTRVAVALTPDGRRLVFAGRQGDRQQLYVRDLSEQEARPIPNTAGADAPFLSPDGRWVGFWVLTRNPDGELKRVPTEGGGPPVAITNTHTLMGASWGEDGTVVYADNHDSGLWRVPSNGGTPQRLTTPAADQYSHRLPHVLPGARAVLFTIVYQKSNWGTTSVAVHRYGTEGWQVLVRGAADARYVPTGHLIYFRRGQLMAAPFDPERLTITGSEVGLVSDVMQAVNLPNFLNESGSAMAAASATGSLAYVDGGPASDLNVQLVWVDRRGQVEQLSIPPKVYWAPRVSPDGHRIAVATAQSERRVWMHDLRVRGSLLPLTEPEMGSQMPVWAPNGKHLVFTGYGKDGLGLFRAQVDGATPPEHLVSLGDDLFPASWTTDGELLFMRRLSLTNMDIWVLPLDRGAATGRPLVATKGVDYDAQVSPNGQWLAYSSNESAPAAGPARVEVYVRRFPSLADRRQVSSDGGSQVVWARNGGELFYVRGNPGARELVAHDVEPSGTVAPVGRVLFRLDPLQLVGSVPVPGFDVSPDGRRFLFARRLDSEAPPPPNQIHIVFNWFEELKAKVPTGK